jgi:hypothetical protein
MVDGDTRLDRCGQSLDHGLQALQTWYRAFGFALATGGAVPPPHTDDEEDARQLLLCVREAAQDRGKATINGALALLLARQHLENASRLETLLGERANAVRTASEDSEP